MTVPGHLPPISRRVRILRIAAVLAVLAALAAVATILAGGPAVRSQRLIAAAVILGAGALVGMALTALPYLHRQKDKHDPRS